MSDLRCGYPTSRLRRLRRYRLLADTVRETDLRAEHMMLPLFVVEGRGIRRPIPSLDGVDHLSVDRLHEAVLPALEVGINRFLIFGLPDAKDPRGTWASHEEGPVQRAVAYLTKQYGSSIFVATDVCLCQYTDHGHCGLLRDDGQVDNAASLRRLAETALSHARAGAHMVAPSAMMDGQVEAIRNALDQSGFHDVSIMGYSAKFHSAFYGPFREAAHSAPGHGDRSTYQIDPANGREALREALQDEAEGADILMVKPSLLYMDVITNLRKETLLPLAAYVVSGEYMMLHHAARFGPGNLIDPRPMIEAHLSLRRAGANLIISYGALDVVRWLRP